ncbi:hypothetical protein CsSME_00017849 [Camellia sinensis var. sinensis]
MLLSAVDLDERAGAIESCSAGGELVPCVGEAILEPHEGMKFESEEAAKGHCVSIMGKFGSVRKRRQSTREGCKAMILVKSDKFGKWVVTKFLTAFMKEVEEHSNQLSKKVQIVVNNLKEFEPIELHEICSCMNATFGSATRKLQRLQQLGSSGLDLIPDTGL